jgi:lysophospholipase L1-like esterase
LAARRLDAKRLLTSLAAAAAALLVGLAAGEAGTRLLSRGGRIYDIEMWKYARLLKADAPAESPEMHHWHVPGAEAILQGVRVKINSRGLRDREHAERAAPGVTRILVLGDSIAFGWGVRVEDAFPTRLQGLFDGASPGRYEVLNGGVGNYTTRRIVALYEHELRRYGASVVIFSFYLNNANETPDSRLQPLFETPLEFPVFVWSRLQRVVARADASASFDAYYRQLYDDADPRYLDFRERLLGFLAARRAEGIRVLLVSLPDVRHLLEPRDRYGWLSAKLARLAEQAETPFLDLYPSVKGLQPSQVMNTPEDRHPNAEGHRRFAESLYRRLRELGV